MICVVPHVVRGAFRLAIRAALEAIIAGHEMHSDVRMERSWKLLMLLPRMVTSRADSWKTGSVDSKRGNGYNCVPRVKSVLQKRTD